VSFRGLYEKLGVSIHDSKRGENADFYSRTANFTDQQADILQRQADKLYDLFLERVSEGRSMDVERVHELARGQIWTGRQAYERDLVDELGGMREAINAAKDLAGIPRDRLARVEVLPKRGFLEKLIDAGIGALGSAGPGLAPNSLARAVSGLSDGRHFAWEPLSIQD
jgi:protease-4